MLPMARAIKANLAVCDQAAMAIKVLRLSGHRDDLTGKTILNYLSQLPTEKSTNPKKSSAAGGRARCYGRALVEAARLVRRHGAELRKAMRGELDELPLAADEVRATQFSDSHHAAA